MAACQVCGHSAHCAVSSVRLNGQEIEPDTKLFCAATKERERHLTPFAAEWTLDSPFRHLAVGQADFFAKVGHPSPLYSLSISHITPLPRCNLTPALSSLQVISFVSINYSIATVGINSANSSERDELTSDGRKQHNLLCHCHNDLE